MGKARIFLRSTDNDYQLALGSILGERRQLNSKLTAIDAKTITNGKIVTEGLSIHYTLDGSNPTPASASYVGPFQTPAVCTVKAIVLRDQEVILNLEETFGPDLGLHWAAPGEATDNTSSTALQAEEAKFKGAVISTNAKGYNGKGFLDFKGKEGFIEFYQENDGPPGDASLLIRIRKGDSTTSTPLKITLNGKSLKHPNLRSNRSWKTVNIPVKIQSGANSLRIETTGNSAPQIDEVDFQ